MDGQAIKSPGINLYCVDQLVSQLRYVIIPSSALLGALFAYDIIPTPNEICQAYTHRIALRVSQVFTGFNQLWAKAEHIER